ncbi:MAG: UPF0179 family protein [Candidatus Bathyarchaeota archaeon]|nr:MAG: UPF0179 family protein [Candidatus Bathyarchaeota archaeon]
MNGEKKQKITLIGLKQAKKCFTFVYEGAAEECKDCNLFTVCISNIESGRIYKITNTRNKIFHCIIHEEGVKVVEVVELDIEGVIESKLAFLGGIISYFPQECKRLSCINYGSCLPQGVRKGEKYKILEIKGKIKCPLDQSFVLAKLQRVVE